MQLQAHKVVVRTDSLACAVLVPCCVARSARVLFLWCLPELESLQLGASTRVSDCNTDTGAPVLFHWWHHSQVGVCW